MILKSQEETFNISSEYYKEFWDEIAKKTKRGAFDD